MAKDEPAEQAPARSKAPIIAAIAALIVGLGGGAGAMWFLGGGESASAEAGEPTAAVEGGEGAKAGEGAKGGEGGEAAAHKKKSVSAGDREITSLGEFVVNLRGNGGGRVLRTEVELEVKPDDVELVETKKALLRDSVITLVSDYAYGDLEGIDGKTALRDELQARLDTALGGGHIDRIYFTQFIVQ